MVCEEDEREEEAVDDARHQGLATSSPPSSSSSSSSSSSPSSSSSSAAPAAPAAPAATTGRVLSSAYDGALLRGDCRGTHRLGRVLAGRDEDLGQEEHQIRAVVPAGQQRVCAGNGRNGQPLHTRTRYMRLSSYHYSSSCCSCSCSCCCSSSSFYCVSPEPSSESYLFCDMTWPGGEDDHEDWCH